MFKNSSLIISIIFSNLVILNTRGPKIKKIFEDLYSRFWDKILVPKETKNSNSLLNNHGIQDIEVQDNVKHRNYIIHVLACDQFSSRTTSRQCIVNTRIYYFSYIILCVDHEMTTMQCRKLILDKNWSYASSVLLEITYLWTCIQQGSNQSFWFLNDDFLPTKQMVK